MKRLRAMAAWWAAASLALTGCAGDAYSHRGIEDPELPVTELTRWSERSELYAQHAPLVAGRALRFAVYVTDLRSFAPVGEGRVVLELEAAGALTTALVSDPPSSPGLFFVGGRVAKAGQYTWRAVVDAPGIQDRHELGTITVYADVASARAADAPPANAAAVSYPKDRQWADGFATETAVEHELRPPLRAPAQVRSAAGGEAIVSAPARGRFAGRPLSAGDSVTEGEPLGQLEPLLDGVPDVATLEADVAVRRAAVVEARTELARAELLLGQRAVPARTLEQARHELDNCRAELRAAEARLLARQQALERGGSASGGNLFAVSSPIAGRLVEVSATSGAVYEQGATLFRVVRSDPVVVEAQLPEADVARLRRVSAAALELPGRDGTLPLAVRAVRHPGVIDPTTHALPVWLEVANPGGRLLIGQTATVLIHTDERRRMLAVPASALLTHAGRTVVFVQLAGESFERRVVQLGPRDGERIGIAAGLEAGARVVTRGAYEVLLAASNPPGRPSEAHVH